VLVFFFQAEDGIRDRNVTGVQTCALPILEAKRQGVPLHVALGGTGDRVAVGADFGVQDSLDILMKKIDEAIAQGFPRIKLKFRRSEGRRVGKEWKSRRWRSYQKKKI